MRYFCLSALLALCASAAHASTYAIDPQHTYVTFEIGHLVSTNRGRFDKKEGVVEFDPAAKTGRVDLTIDTTSINTGFAAFNKHLQSKDFFKAEEFPTARFTADSFGFNGDQVSTVNGNLTLVGQTHPVVLKASRFACAQNPLLKREVCGGDFEATITRSQWGVTWGLSTGYPDTVRLVIQVEAIKQ